jgi:molybdopterin molybdotransferase
MNDTALAPDIARARLLETVSAITQPQSLPLAECLGHRLAASLIAEANLPATANAAVDGYAIHADFLAANPDYDFKIIGRAAAGHPFTGTVNKGEAVRIFTGAIMPNEGHAPDAVAMHEMCRANNAGTFVKVDARLKPASNSRPAGENIRIGETLIPAGTRLGPADIGIAAAAGHANLSVHRQLIVGVISMGDEIVTPGGTPAYGQSYDSNLPMLQALLGADGHDVRTFPIVPDQLDALVAAYRDAFEICDVVISSGGASDGDEDHTQSAI